MLGLLFPTFDLSRIKEFGDIEVLAGQVLL
jgi:hypothetical protein